MAFSQIARSEWQYSSAPRPLRERIEQELIAVGKGNKNLSDILNFPDLARIRTFVETQLDHAHPSSSTDKVIGHAEICLLYIVFSGAPFSRGLSAQAYYAVLADERIPDEWVTMWDEGRSNALLWGGAGFSELAWCVTRVAFAKLMY